MKKTLSPAAYVIQQFGGVRPLARAIDRNPSSVLLWTRPRSMKGAGGAIPSVAQTAIMGAAKRLGIQIDPARLVKLP